VALAVAACIFAGAVLLLAAPRGDRLRRRLAPYVGARARKRARGRTQERFATASMVMRATERAFGHLRVWHWLHRLLERADVPLRTVELVYAAAGSGLLLGLLFAVAGAPALVTLLAIVCGAAIPVLVVSVKARRRLAAIEEQLPDLLVTLAASLKAGHSFHQGIQAVVDEGQPPASAEFKRVLTDTRLGRSMDDALAEMGERVSSKNLTFVLTAVTIQRQVGGSLAGIFDMVADAVRQRQQFARKIRSLTAMGRASAYVLVGIPFFLLGAISLVNAEYMDPLYHTSTGHTLMVAGVVMIAFGSLVLRRIVSFRG
jgi:tight adherence protein B